MPWRSSACKHVVITSVDRDDLPDGGAAHFAAVIRAIRAAAPATTIEVLTPDFLRKPGAVEIVAEARPDVFNHNLETVPRLYPAIRPGARYYQSLRLLDRVKALDPGMFTKSGLMVGLGESRAEILQVMDDLRIADVDFLTIGQYLQPTVKHAAIDRFVTPEEFAEYAATRPRQGVPAGVRHAADPQLLSRRCGFRRAAGGRARASSPRDVQPAARCPRTPSARSCPTARSSSSIWSPMSDDIRNSCPGASAPACAAGRTTELVADLTIGFGPFRESFTSRVTLDRPAPCRGALRERSVPLPEQSMGFHPASPAAREVDFFVDFEFRSRILQAAIGVVFNEAVRRMVNAFHRRAREVYGPPHRTAHRSATPAAPAKG